jgi:hypothetical protein
MWLWEEGAGSGVGARRAGLRASASAAWRQGEKSAGGVQHSRPLAEPNTLCFPCEHSSFATRALLLVSPLGLSLSLCAARARCKRHTSEREHFSVTPTRARLPKPPKAWPGVRDAALHARRPAGTRAGRAPARPARAPSGGRAHESGVSINERRSSREHRRAVLLLGRPTDKRLPGPPRAACLADGH